jgi:3-deoxy-D-manno-octulosonate 8-phosphate phosphatase (KDO 8-P phosphatase)
MASSPASEDLAARCAPIELLVLDVDGVLTDGTIVIADTGVEMKHFHVRDGAAIALWHRAGKRSAIISGRRASCVDHRAAELRIAPVLQGVDQKASALRGLLSELSLDPHHVCFVGDDLADLGALRVAGLAACPSDAAAEVRELAHLVTAFPGGRGCVRAVVETILKHQKAWSPLLNAMSNE